MAPASSGRTSSTRRFRPIGDTARDTLAWLDTVTEEERTKFRTSGIKPEKEASVLAAWAARTP